MYRKVSSTHKGIIAITLDHPKRNPQRLKSDISSIYARRFTLTSTSWSVSHSPGGRALRSFFLFDVNFMFWWLMRVAGVRSNRPSCLPNLFSTVSFKTFLKTNFPIMLAIVSELSELSEELRIEN